MNLNQENLPRIDPDKPSPRDALRNCLRAPKGGKVVVADLSGIELRVNHFLWKVASSMSLFKADPEKADLYREFAGRLYEKAIADISKNERQVGKVAHLGLGFGAGAATFKRVAKTMAGIELPLPEAESVVTAWRSTYPEIVKGWRRCHAALAAINEGSRYEIDAWGLCYTSSEGIHTPCGIIRYPGLHMEAADEREEWWYGDGRNRTRIYAGKITENIVQHLARNILADNMLLIKKRFDVWPVHCVHDELIYIVTADMAESFLEQVQSVMRTPPVWWPELIVWSEGAVGDTYGEAK